MASKDYFLTDHAKDRMRQRKISEDDTESIFKNPEMSYPGRHGETSVVGAIKGRMTVC
jgi:hypothetical protein